MIYVFSIFGFFAVLYGFYIDDVIMVIAGFTFIAIPQIERRFDPDD